MKRLVPVITVLVLLPLAPARADWAYTKWGMSPAQVVTASKGEASLKAKREKLEEMNMEVAADGTHSDGGLKLRTAFEFDAGSGGLRCVLYAPQSSAQDELLMQTLTKQYGAPSKSGPAGLFENYTWKTATDEIILTIENKRSNVSHCKK
jgi:hypothetical protein